MQSRKAAGLTQLPRFVKAGEIGGLPFEILGAQCRTSQFGPEVVYVIRGLTENEAPLWYDQVGEPVGPVVSVSFAESPSRLRDVQYFGSRNAESLGPCRFDFLPSKVVGHSGYIDIVDCEPAFDAPSVPVNGNAALPAASTKPAAGLSGDAAKARAAQAVAARGRRPVHQPDPSGDDLEDVPF